jgi:membrane protease YdiL (CAAX protease family)
MIARGWPWLGASLTTVLFAWLHEPVPGEGVHLLQWLWLLAGYAALGAMFAWVYWRTRRWSAAFAAHASNNLIACSLLWFGIG